MEIKKIKVFSYEELSDSSRERARAKFLEGADYPWWSDAEVSIRAFCKFFGVSKLDYSIGGYCPSYITAEADNSHFKGRKLKDFKGKTPADAYYCLEFELWDNFVNIWEATGSPLIAFNQALDKACWSIQKDMEYHQSDEYAAETIELNEYLFTEDGDFANYKFTEEAA